MSQHQVGLAHEQLEELAWTRDGPLTLRRREVYPQERWVLEQRGRPLAVIERAETGWSLTMATQRCSVAIRRPPRRLGWQLEVTSSGETSPRLTYRPTTFRAGGTFQLATGRRYQLRHSAYDWTLAGRREGVLARISGRVKPPTGSELAHDQTGLTPAAASEPELDLLIGAVCVAIAAHHEQPVSTGTFW